MWRYQRRRESLDSCARTGTPSPSLIRQLTHSPIQFQGVDVRVVVGLGEEGVERLLYLAILLTGLGCAGVGSDHGT